MSRSVTYTLVAHKHGHEHLQHVKHLRSTAAGLHIASAGTVQCAVRDISRHPCQWKDLDSDTPLELTFISSSFFFSFFYFSFMLLPIKQQLHLSTAVHRS